MRRPNFWHIYCVGTLQRKDKNSCAPHKHTTSTHLQHYALVKVVGTGPSLESGESHIASGERRDITELVRTQSSPLILSWSDVTLGIFPEGFTARGAVILVGQPGSILPCALIDGEALRPTGVEFQSYIGYLKGLPCGKQIYLVQFHAWLWIV